MKKSVALCFFIFLTNAYSDELKEQLKAYQYAVKAAGIPPKTDCGSGPVRPVDLKFAKGNYKKADLFSERNFKHIDVSVLTEEKAQEVFEILKTEPSSAWNYIEDGCFVRAHRMAQVMDKMGIVSAKAVIDVGDSYRSVVVNDKVTWNYHVASVVMVLKNGSTKPEPYVIDPAIFDKPVPHSIWKEWMVSRMTPLPKGEEDNPAMKIKEYFTSRFNYYRSHWRGDLKAYQEEAQKDMEKNLYEMRVNNRLAPN